MKPRKFEAEQGQTGRMAPCSPLRMMVPDFDGSAWTGAAPAFGNQLIETLAIPIQ